MGEIQSLNWYIVDDLDIQIQILFRNSGGMQNIASVFREMVFVDINISTYNTWLSILFLLLASCNVFSSHDSIIESIISVIILV